MTWLAICFCSLAVLAQKHAKPVEYVLIKKSNEIPGKINHSAIDKLDEPLRAVAAYYSGLGGGGCQQGDSPDETCELTTALGLGKQGSKSTKRC